MSNDFRRLSILGDSAFLKDQNFIGNSKSLLRIMGNNNRSQIIILCDRPDLIFNRLFDHTRQERLKARPKEGFWASLPLFLQVRFSVSDHRKADRFFCSDALPVQEVLSAPEPPLL